MLFMWYRFCVKSVLEENAEDIAFFDKFVEKGLLHKLENVRDVPFGSITYTEAVDLLQNSGQKFNFPVSWGCDLQSEHERWLAETHFKKPVFVYNYPASIKVRLAPLSYTRTSIPKSTLMSSLALNKRQRNKIHRLST